MIAGDACNMQRCKLEEKVGMGWIVAGRLELHLEVISVQEEEIAKGSQREWVS